MSRRPFAWEKSYPPGLQWDLDFSSSTLVHLFDEAMQRHGERNAIESGA